MTKKHGINLAVAVSGDGVKMHVGKEYLLGAGRSATIWMPYKEAAAFGRMIQEAAGGSLLDQWLAQDQKERKI